MALRVVCGAVVRGGRALAVRRGPGGAAAGKWELPGGKVEAGEGDAQALARELKEELGIDVRVEQYLDEAEHEYPTLRLRLVAWRCALLDPAQEPALREHTALVWLSAEELPALDWAPADLPLLPALAASLRAGGAA